MASEPACTAACPRHCDETWDRSVSTEAYPIRWCVTHLFPMSARSKRRDCLWNDMAAIPTVCRIVDATVSWEFPVGV